MESTTLYTLLLLSSLIFYLLSGFIRLLVRQALSPLALLRGPPCPSFFMGNLMEMHDQENNNLVAEWEAAYGSTFVYRGFIGGCRLMTTDPVAVAHILGNAYDYPKPDFVRDSLATMAAGHDGLLVVEGDAHKRQVCELCFPSVLSVLIQHFPCSVKSWSVPLLCFLIQCLDEARNFHHSLIASVCTYLFLPVCPRRDLSTDPYHSLPHFRRPTSNHSPQYSGTRPPRCVDHYRPRNSQGFSGWRFPVSHLLVALPARGLYESL
jgi:hypothetical protein